MNNIPVAPPPPTPQPQTQQGPALPQYDPNALLQQYGVHLPAYNPFLYFPAYQMDRQTMQPVINAQGQPQETIFGRHPKITGALEGAIAGLQGMGQGGMTPNENIKAAVMGAGAYPQMMREHYMQHQMLPLHMAQPILAGQQSVAATQAAQAQAQEAVARAAQESALAKAIAGPAGGGGGYGPLKEVADFRNKVTGETVPLKIYQYGAMTKADGTPLTPTEQGNFVRISPFEAAPNYKAQTVYVPGIGITQAGYDSHSNTYSLPNGKTLGAGQVLPVSQQLTGIIQIASNPNASPGQKQIAKNVLDTMTKYQSAIAQARGVGYGLGRAMYTPYPVVNATGQPATVSELTALKTGTPRVTLDNYKQAIAKSASFNDLDTQLTRVQAALKSSHDIDWNKVALASTPSSGGIISGIWHGAIRGSLNPQETDIVNTLNNLRSTAQNLRSFIGASSGSDAQLQNLLRELPDEASFFAAAFSKGPQYAENQLASYAKVLASIQAEYTQYMASAGMGIPLPGGQAGSAIPGQSVAPPTAAPAQAPRPQATSGTSSPRSAIPGRTAQKPVNRKAPGAGAAVEVRVNGKIVGYTTDGKTMTPVG